MNVADAHAVILQHLGRVNSLYGQPVFNEWVLVAMRNPGGAILAYEGPRAESYKRQFPTDIASMQRELADEKLAVGDFLFAREAHGTHYDACIRLGETSYLFCNHTQRTMTDIRLSPHWLAAQKAWVELCQRFAADPLE